ncbi:MAG TPA: DUF1801 domain-containing protein [Lacunisphaera sp.]|nr:DUF1801 domain-containing protein [Lacunisphaera sp.]
MFPAKKVPSGTPASALIDEKIELLPDWRGKTLAALRQLIHEADPEVVEEWKWGTPVWSHAGILCTGEVYKAAVKMTFPKGAALPDPKGLFNSSLEGNVRRAIDVREGDRLNAPALKSLFRAAVALNLAGKSKPTRAARATDAPKTKAAKAKASKALGPTKPAKAASTAKNSPAQGARKKPAVQARPKRPS